MWGSERADGGGQMGAGKDGERRGRGSGRRFEASRAGSVGGRVDDRAMDASSNGDGRDFDLSGYVRRARRLGDLSQRDLACGLGLGQTAIARVENGGDIGVRWFVRILAAADLRLVVVDAAGTVVAPMPGEVFRDGAGRRRPAHLDVHALPERPTFRMLLHDCDPIPRNGVWHHGRSERDRLRETTGRGADEEQLTPSIAAARRAARSRVAAAR